MAVSLTADVQMQLEKLGLAIDVKVPVSAFCGGRVGLNSDFESEVISDVTQGQARRSAARSWQGQRSSRGQRWGTTCSQHHFGADAVEQAFGAQFRLLAQHYEALATEDEHGLWVSVRAHPLGTGGPQVHFLIGLPLNSEILPRAWAFERIGPNAAPLELRHTNFPDASICAFTPDDGAWKAEDGILALVDLYSVWIIKKWHFETFGWWPGPQYGGCALYRRLEFQGREWCGCRSGLRYAECHKEADLLVNDAFARNEFKQLFKVDYESRMVPEPLLDAAISRWRKLPSLRSVFLFRLTNEPLVGF
jgi:hypothetical protein